jgi:TRAP-type C4-dicarboxylate transport system permease small subunit
MAVGAERDGAGAGGWLTRLLVGLNGIGSVWIFALMVLINTDAFSRTLFTAPIYGVNEMIELSIVGIVFLQLGDATRTGRLTRSDGLFRLFLRRRPTAGRFLGVLFDGLGAVFMGLILYGSYPLLAEAWENDYYVGNEGVFTAPVWPIRTIVVVGCLVTLAQFLAFAWRYARGDSPD